MLNMYRFQEMILPTDLFPLQLIYHCICTASLIQQASQG